MSEVFGEADAKDNNTPTDHVKRQGPAHFVPLKDDVGRELEAHVCDVEDGGQPGILLSNKVRVVAEAKGCLCAEGCFVGLLNSVADPHEGKEIPVHFPSELLVLLVRILACDAQVSLYLDMYIHGIGYFETLDM